MSKPKKINFDDLRETVQGTGLEKLLPEGLSEESPREDEGGLDRGGRIKFVTILRGKKEITLLSLENICRVLKYDEQYANTIRYDEFKEQVELRVDGKWEAVSDHRVLAIQKNISVRYLFFGLVSGQMTRDAIESVAHEPENVVDTARDYFASLTWDGVARLDTWLVHAYGVPHDAYHIAVGKNWIMGLVKRVVHPGSKFDHVMVLEGGQGIKKSTSLIELIGNEWHIETTKSPSSDEFLPLIEGKIIVEFSEGESLSRSEVKAIKSFITTTQDKYRKKYARFPIERKRRCVFAMTTNQSEYLKDETGNRRWLPVKVLSKEVDVEWIKENREQLFAEAYHRVITNKEKYWEYPKEETLAQQAERRISNPDDNKVIKWYRDLSPIEQERGVTISDCYDACFRGVVYNHILEVNEPDKRPIPWYVTNHIVSVFREHLKLENKVRRIGDALTETGRHASVKVWIPIDPLRNITFSDTATPIDENDDRNVIINDDKNDDIDVSKIPF